jgi:putative restriction endonuclease
MAAAPRINWTREQLLIVLNLYHKLRFGQISSRLPAIIDLAEKLGRTPSSVSMKLGNLASFDPVLQLRGIKGLQGASHLDRDTWDEYHSNPAELIPLAQEKFDALFAESENDTTEVIPGKGIRRVPSPPTRETETQGISKRRKGQDYFREVVINNYNGCCGITGLPVRELLVASHILPWSAHEAERLNVRNGIALNRLHDAAFDKHLVAFDDELRLILSARLKSFLPDVTIAYHFEAYEGKVILLPDDGIPPDMSFLAMHRKKLAG